MKTENLTFYSNGEVKRLGNEEMLHDCLKRLLFLTLYDSETICVKLFMLKKTKNLYNKSNLRRV